MAGLAPDDITDRFSRFDLILLRSWKDLIVRSSKERITKRKQTPRSKKIILFRSPRYNIFFSAQDNADSFILNKSGRKTALPSKVNTFIKKYIRRVSRIAAIFVGHMEFLSVQGASV